MRIVRSFHQCRATWLLGLFVLLGLVAGCGEPAATVASPEAEAEAQTKQNDMRAAMEKGFSEKGSNPGKGKASKPPKPASGQSKP